VAVAGAVTTRWRFWLGAAVVFVLTLWLLNDILLPFVVGMAVAYFLDPVVVRLQRLGLSRTWATTTVTILAALLGIGPQRVESLRRRVCAKLEVSSGAHAVPRAASCGLPPPGALRPV